MWVASFSRCGLGCGLGTSGGLGLGGPWLLARSGEGTEVVPGARGVLGAKGLGVLTRVGEQRGVLGSLGPWLFLDWVAMRVLGLGPGWLCAPGVLRFENEEVVVG